MVIMICWLI
jgi:hypothetical protein